MNPSTVTAGETVLHCPLFGRPTLRDPFRTFVNTRRAPDEASAAAAAAAAAQ